MRNIPSYKWEDILNEECSRTFVSLELLSEEKEKENKAYEKSKRKGRRH